MIPNFVESADDLVHELLLLPARDADLVDQLGDPADGPDAGGEVVAQALALGAGRSL